MIKLGIYKHYKNQKEYKIICLAKIESDETDVVVYQGLYDNKPIWVRPLDSFSDTVDYEGKLQPRFTWLRETK